MKKFKALKIICDSIKFEKQSTVAGYYFRFPIKEIKPESKVSTYTKNPQFQMNYNSDKHVFHRDWVETSTEGSMSFGTAFGIKPGDTLYWNARGRPRRLEKKALRRITTSKLARWAGGEVRDASILYIDAINIASYLRSNVAAHVGDVAGLTAIDAANVQQLARLLLLHAVGFHFWKHLEVGRESAA